MAKQVSIPHAKGGFQKIWKMFDIINGIYFLVGITISSLLLRMVSSISIAIILSVLITGALTVFSFLRIPKGKKDLPSNMRADVFVYNMILKKLRHKGIYSKAYDFEKSYQNITKKNRVVQKERY